MIGFPPLDCHAHISPDVTGDQLARLAPAIIFAVTRSPDEARCVVRRRDQHVVWGLGAHPSYVAKGGEVDLSLLHRLLPHFALLGEIGLDRRSGHLDRQTAGLRRVLEAIREEPVVLSLHSSGCIDKLLDMLEVVPHPGVVLHWFTGTPEQLDRASRLGCYFSVNVGMDLRLISQVPPNRLLPETDYPATRRRGCQLPGDLAALESAVVSIHDTTIEDVRMQWYRNLRTLMLDSGAIDRLPSTVSDLLLLV